MCHPVCEGDVQGRTEIKKKQRIKELREMDEIPKNSKKRWMARLGTMKSTVALWILNMHPADLKHLLHSKGHSFFKPSMSENLNTL